jgi:hypothetical protein
MSFTFLTSVQILVMVVLRFTILPGAVPRAKMEASWDMIMRARSLLGRSNRSDSKSAIAILERAVDCYPEYGPAYSMLAGALAASAFLFVR